MVKFINIHSKTICYILAFIIPVFYMLIICISLGFFPFGIRNPLVADTKVQFSSYIAYLKTIFYGKNDFFYTFSKTIGGDMMGFSFYYLANPLIYILLLVPNEMLPAGILFLIILMMALSSLFFNIMLNNIFGFRYSSLIYSTSYAFIGYFMAYYNFVIYFFNVMLLPLIILGLYELVTKKKRNYKYIIFLALSIVANYYIGYMTCIFCLLMFIYLFVVKYEKDSFKEHTAVIFHFIGSSILAAMLSSVALLTVFYSLRGQKITDDAGIRFPTGINFNLRDVFAQLYTTGFNGNISDGLPVIYIGTVAVAFLFLYFMNKEIKLKEKIASGIFILIMLLSFYVKFISIVWHGFSEPVGFPHRNSFFLSFFMLLISYKGFLLMKQGTRKFHTLIIFGIFILYSLYMYISKNAYVGIVQIILTGTFLAMILAGVYAICYKREYMYPIIIGFFLILTFDLLHNGYYSISRYFDSMNEVSEDEAIDYYTQFYNENKDILEYIKNDNGNSYFYRVDKLYRMSHNDPMLLGYSGLSHFSSCESIAVKDFMDSLGFPTNSMWSYYGGEGNTAFLDSFFSLKYMISQYDETKKPYTLLNIVHDKYIFKNPYTLGLAFAAKDSVNDADLSDYNVFTRQNEIAKCITGELYGLYRPVEIKDIKYENVEKYEKSFTRLDSTKEAYVEFDLNITSSDFIYGNFTFDEPQATEFTVNGLFKMPYFTYYDCGTRCIGYFEENTVVPVRIYLKQDQIEINTFDFYYESKEELARFYNDVMKSSVKTSVYSSSDLKITADIDNSCDTVVLTIPYDEGWTVKVDGEKVPVKKVFSTLLAFDITPGRHRIELTFMPKGLIAGAVISLAAALLLIILHITDIVKAKRLLNGEQ